MAESRRGLCLASKAREHLRVMGYVFGQKLQGHKSLQASVFRFIHHSHPAAAKLFKHPVMFDRSANHVPQPGFLNGIVAYFIHQANAGKVPLNHTNIVKIPMARSAPTHSRSRLNQARRSTATPSL